MANMAEQFWKASIRCALPLRMRHKQKRRTSAPHAAETWDPSLPCWGEGKPTNENNTNNKSHKITQVPTYKLQHLCWMLDFESNLFRVCLLILFAWFSFFIFVMFVVFLDLIVFVASPNLWGPGSLIESWHLGMLAKILATLAQNLVFWCCLRCLKQNLL